jgi:L-lactate utilization protein LutB
MPHLEELYEAFKAKAEAAGVKVHLAATAREANEIIAGIARDNQVKKIVKSKSMTAEETFLNDHLEAEGLEWWKRTWENGSSNCAMKGRRTW